METLTFVCVGAIQACLSAWLLLLLNKLGAIDWLEINGNDFFSKMARCQFCLSWWTNVVFTTIGVLATNDFATLFILPFVATPITRKLLW